jgi:hypothetical protein
MNTAERIGRKSSRGKEENRSFEAKLRADYALIRTVIASQRVARMRAR